MGSKARSPYEPFATAVGFCAWIYTAGLLIGLLSAAVGWTHVYSLDSGPVCVRDTDVATGGGGGLPPIFKPGVAVTSTTMSLCADHASRGQDLLNGLTHLPGFVLYGGVLMLLRWLLRGVERHGPFSAMNARRVRFIGWWLLVGGIAAPSVETLAHNLLVRTMMRASQAPGSLAQLPGLSVSAVLTGLGLLVIARILAVGARMQDELAATI